MSDEHEREVIATVQGISNAIEKRLAEILTPEQREAYGVCNLWGSWPGSPKPTDEQLAAYPEIEKIVNADPQIQSARDTLYAMGLRYREKGDNN